MIASVILWKSFRNISCRSEHYKLQVCRSEHQKYSQKGGGGALEKKWQNPCFEKTSSKVKIFSYERCH